MHRFPKPGTHKLQYAKIDWIFICIAYMTYDTVTYEPGKRALFILHAKY